MVPQFWMQEMGVARIVNDPKMASEVGLSEEQLKTLKDSADQSKIKREELQKQLMELGTQQAKLMEETTVDENAVLAALEKASQIRLELDKVRIKNVLLIKKTLTPEQSAKIKEMMEQNWKAHEGERGQSLPGAEKPATPPVPAK